MKTLAQMVICLEKRVFALEEAAGIKPDKDNLTHPHAQKQAKERAKKVEVKK